jgi:hypothetical protein
VEKVYTGGSSLFADLKQVSSNLIGVLKSGAYKKRSAEIYPAASSPTGRPYLKGLAFLGAKTPHVKGMAEVVFADERGEFVCFDMDAPTLEFSMSIPEAPDGAAHETLTRQTTTGMNLDHAHNAYLDAVGNGFTGPTTDQWGYNNDPKGHQHTIKAGAVEAYGDEEIANHTHSMTASFAETEKGNTIMEPNKETTTAPVAAFAAPEGSVVVKADELAAMRAKIDAGEKREVIRFAEDNKREFIAAVDKAISEGRMAPAKKEKALAKFDADSEFAMAGVVCFSETDAKKDFFKRAVQEINELEQFIPIGPSETRRATVNFDDKKPMARGTTDTRLLDARAQAIVKQNNWPMDEAHFSEAALMATAEATGSVLNGSAV